MRRSDITQWGVEHPWQNKNQIEQDLLLSMAMVEIVNDPLLGSELVLRGGTAFHKLFLPEPYRYSEDLDFVRTASTTPSTRERPASRPSSRKSSAMLKHVQSGSYLG